MDPNSAFIVKKREQLVTGEEEHPITEVWSVNDSQKQNMCNWLCENGTAEDFQHFQVIFDMLEELLPTGQTT